MDAPRSGGKEVPSRLSEGCRRQPGLPAAACSATRLTPAQELGNATKPMEMAGNDTGSIGVEAAPEDHNDTSAEGL
jgi:hypothetical protein